MQRQPRYRRREALSVWAMFFVIAMAPWSVAAAAARQGRTWDFDTNQAGEAPEGFSFARTGRGRMGRWVVRAEQDAPSGTNVLVQLDDDPTDFRFPLAVAVEPKLRDLRLSVRCKSVAGTVDQACGLVVRYHDEDHYYLARANALEQNVRFYKVVAGTRQQLASWSGPVTTGVWHGLRLEARADHFTVFWDGQRVLDVRDQAFGEAGSVGLWTKADSVTAFDDFTVEPLASQP